MDVKVLRARFQVCFLIQLQCCVSQPMFFALILVVQLPVFCTCLVKYLMISLREKLGGIMHQSTAEEMKAVSDWMLPSVTAVLWRDTRRNTLCPLKSLFQSFSFSTDNGSSYPSYEVCYMLTQAALQYVLRLFAGLLLSLEQMLQAGENQVSAYSGGTVFKNLDLSTPGPSVVSWTLCTSKCLGVLALRTTLF